MTAWKCENGKENQQKGHCLLSTVLPYDNFGAPACVDMEAHAPAMLFTGAVTVLVNKVGGPSHQYAACHQCHS